MAGIPGIRRVFRFPWRTRRSLESDFEEELRFHLDMRAEELATRRGLTPAEAQGEALRQFGDVEDARSYIYAMDEQVEITSTRRARMDGLRQDLIHACRGLRRSPGFTAVVILSLALGIGTATAVFTMVDAFLLRPLPIAHPEGLVGFGDPTAGGRTDVGPPSTSLFSFPLYTELREQSRLVPDLAAAGYSGRFAVVVSREEGAPASQASGAGAEEWKGRLVSGNYFRVLGVRAAAGRLITPDDDRGAGGAPVAVISHAYWERRFESDPSIVGRTLLVNRTPVTIIGVAAPDFIGEVAGHGTGIWMPLSLEPVLLPNQDWLRRWDTSWLLLLGRPEGGAAAAGAELTSLARRAVEAATNASPEDVSRLTVDAYPIPRGFDGVPREGRMLLVVLLALAGLLLVVVCANVANLLLARASARRAELGVRLALGASRWRVMRSLLVETLVLGTVAGGLALFVLYGATEILVRRMGLGAASGVDLARDPRVLAFAATLSFLTAGVLGLLPAAKATRVDVGFAMRSHAGGLHGDPLLGGRRRLGLGRWLVVGQIAVSLVLLTGAGLFYRAANNLGATDIGVARDELLVVRVDAHETGFEGVQLRSLYSRLAERLSALPGVRSASYSRDGLFSGIETTTTVEVPGFEPSSATEEQANADAVGPDYFRTVGARLLRGRGLEARDNELAPPVAVINESMARYYFGAGDATGHRVRVNGVDHEIVGVVADIRGTSLRGDAGRRYYTPVAQGGEAESIVFVVRTEGDPGALAAAARREILETEPILRVRNALPLSTNVRESILPEIIVASVAGAAGFLALGLAALGLFGVMTYAIVRRTSEFGLRIALGARPEDVTRMVLRETMGLFLLGCAIGLPLAMAIARLLRQQLVGVGLVDLPSLAIAVAVLGASASLAGYRPARRAAGIDPQVALSRE
jgi:predicted permease